MAEVALQSVGLKAADGSVRPFHHRGTPADLGVINQMFAAEDYSIARLARGPQLQAFYHACLEAGERPLILDAGANIGASIVYFSLAYPQAHILALEPAKNNFELLRLNAAGIDVDARCAAIGARAGEVVLTDPGQGEWGYRTAAEGAGARVPRLGAADLVSEKCRAGFKPFLAKIDIEGAEGELFSADTAWADAFPLLIIELHDWLLPGAGTAKSFLAWAASRQRDFVFIGENVFSIAHELRAPGVL